MNTYASPSSLLQVLEQVHDAGLDRHVERRHRLVEHEQRRARARARGRCRCAGADRRRTRAGSGSRARGSGRPVASSSRDPLDSVAPCTPWIAQRLGDDRRDRHARVQRRVRVLEDDLHLARAARAARRARRVEHVDALEAAPSPTSARAGAGRSRPVVDLPAARLPHQPERLAPRRPTKRHARHGLHRPTVPRERPPRTGKSFTRSRDLEHRRRRRRPASAPSTPSSRRERHARLERPRRSGTPTSGRPRPSRSSGRSVAQTPSRRRTGSAGGTRSPAAGCISDGGAPAMRCSRSLAAPVEPRQRREQPARVRMARLVEDLVDRRRARPAGPAYITSTRSATPATTPRSWVISMIDECACGPGSARARSSTCAWIVTSSAVVGSSAMSTSGSLAIAIAIIARWRMPPENSCGYCSRALAGLRDADEVEQLDRAARRARPRSRRGAPRSPRRSGRRPCTPGSARPAGPGRPSRCLRAADAVCSSFGLAPEQLLAAELRRAGDRRRCFGSSPRIASDVTVLPEPDSPTMPSVSPAATSRSTPRPRGPRRRRS